MYEAVDNLKIYSEDISTFFLINKDITFSDKFKKVLTKNLQENNIQQSV